MTDQKHWCSQCGQDISMPACGPTHAILFSEFKEFMTDQKHTKELLIPNDEIWVKVKIGKVTGSPVVEMRFDESSGSIFVDTDFNSFSRDSPINLNAKLILAINERNELRSMLFKVWYLLANRETYALPTNFETIRQAGNLLDRIKKFF